MSLSVLDSSGGEVARGHYLSTLPFDGSRVLEKKQLKANHTNGSGSSACRGTELLGKLQSPWWTSMSCPEAECDNAGLSLSIKLEEGSTCLTWNEPGISGPVGIFIYTWLIGTLGLWGVVTWGHGCRCACAPTCLRYKAAWNPIGFTRILGLCINLPKPEVTYHNWRYKSSFLHL